MDSLTQATLGALCGELLLRKQLGWKAAAWGAFFGTLPDLDIIMSPWLDAMDRLRNHRGLSHSIFLMLLASPLLGHLLTRIHKNITLARASSFVLLAWSTHVFIDCFNSYGTQIFEPFSDYRITLNNISIIDLFFTLPMLVGVISALFWKPDSKTRTKIITLSTIWITLYTVSSFVLQSMAQHHFQQELAERDIRPSKTLSSSTLGNIFLWRMLARDDSHYYISYWSIFDSSDRPTKIDIIPRTPALASPYLHSKAFKTLDWFSKGWWKIVANSENSIFLMDLRFGEIPHTIDTETVKSSPFIWELTYQKDGSVTEQRASARGKVDAKEHLTQLYERAAGRSPEWLSNPWVWELRTQ